MTKLTVDPELRAKLGDFQDLVEFCDESGRVVGFFHPAAPSRDALNQRIISPISDEEIEAARGQRTGRQLPEILADLDRADRNRRA
jgi:hypothetical protein